MKTYFSSYNSTNSTPHTRFKRVAFIRGEDAKNIAENLGEKIAISTMCVDKKTFPALFSHVGDKINLSNRSKEGLELLEEFLVNHGIPHDVIDPDVESHISIINTENAITDSIQAEPNETAISKILKAQEIFKNQVGGELVGCHRHENKPLCIIASGDEIKILDKIKNNIKKERIACFESFIRNIIKVFSDNKKGTLIPSLKKPQDVINYFITNDFEYITKGILIKASNGSKLNDFENGVLRERKERDAYKIYKQLKENGLYGYGDYPDPTSVYFKAKKDLNEMGFYYSKEKIMGYYAGKLEAAKGTEALKIASQFSNIKYRGEKREDFNALLRTLTDIINHGIACGKCNIEPISKFLGRKDIKEEDINIVQKLIKKVLNSETASLIEDSLPKDSHSSNTFITNA